MSTFGLLCGGIEREGRVRGWRVEVRSPSRREQDALFEASATGPKYRGVDVDGRYLRDVLFAMAGALHRRFGWPDLATTVPVLVERKPKEHV